jgi:hypothetical protein
VHASDASSIDDLAVEMEQLLHGLEPAAGEQLTVVQWDVDCSAPLTDELRRSSLSSLWELIDAGAETHPARLHLLRSVSRSTGMDQADARDSDEDLSLEANLRIDLEQLIERVTHAEWGSTSWAGKVARKLSRLSPAHLLPKVREAVNSAMRQAGNT